MSAPYTIQNFIGGSLIEGDGESFTLINPATEDIITSYREAGASLAAQAHEAAQ